MSAGLRPAAKRKDPHPRQPPAAAGTMANRRDAEAAAMPSPFPGMDPYLEADAVWPAFQHQLVAGLYQILLPNLVDRYRARVGQRAYVTEVALFTSVVRDQHAEEFIELRQRGDGRLVTLIDVVSPCNKATPEGRQAYLTKRHDARAGGANLV